MIFTVDYFKEKVSNQTSVQRLSKISISYIHYLCNWLVKKKKNKKKKKKTKSKLTVNL